MRLMRRARPLIGLALIISALGMASCGDARRTTRSIAGGDATLGRQAVLSYGCTSCHAIPGIRTPGGLNSHVGPPLENFATRRYIAGTLANTDTNLVNWIQNPQAIRPGSAMPNIGVSETDARHIAAFLYSLNTR
jgi:cytochrome c